MILTVNPLLVRFGVRVGKGRLASTVHRTTGLWDSGDSKPAASAWRDGGDPRQQRRDHARWSLGIIR